MKQFTNNGQFKKGMIPWNKGVKGSHFSTKTEFKKGQIPWNKGLKFSNKSGKNHHGYKHGMIKTNFYGVWNGIKQRCLNPNVLCYKNYGGRGITVCKEWLVYQNFQNDMYQSYQQHCLDFGVKQTTIERIDNDGDYELSNCKWATRKEQILNQRPKKFIA